MEGGGAGSKSARLNRVVTMMRGILNLRLAALDAKWQKRGKRASGVYCSSSRFSKKGQGSSEKQRQKRRKCD